MSAALKRPVIRTAVEVALISVLAFAAVLAVLEWHRADQAQSQRSVREAVAARAVGVATNLFTYDYRNLGTTESYLSRFAAGGFAQREAAHNQSVQEQLSKAKAVGSATVKEVTVSDISDGQATAFVVLATHVTSVTSGSADNIAYLHVHLRLVGEIWKVDDVQNLTAAT